MVHRSPASNNDSSKIPIFFLTSNSSPFVHFSSVVAGAMYVIPDSQTGYTMEPVCRLGVHQRNGQPCVEEKTYIGQMEETFMELGRMEIMG